jgi:hypothetical protein
MSDEQDEQKYGLEGIEQSQGYSPMPMANPDPEPALSDEQVAHFNRPAPPPPVERSYNDVNTGEPTPDNQTVELERASRDISEIRAAERAALEQQRNADLNEALDYLRSEEETMRQAMEPRPVQPADEITSPPRLYEQPAEPQPEALQPQPEHTEVPGVDPEIAQALQNPKIRGMLEQVSLGVQQTAAQYQQAQAQLAAEAVAMVAAAAPELAGMSPAQAQGALQLMHHSNPQRAQQIAQLVGRAQNLVAQHQQAAAQTAQHQQALAAEQFRQFAQASDDRFDAMNRNMPREQMSAIKQEAVTMLKEYGLSDADLAREYNSNPLFRSAAGQQMHCRRRSVETRATVSFQGGHARDPSCTTPRIIRRSADAHPGRSGRSAGQAETEHERQGSRKLPHSPQSSEIRVEQMNDQIVDQLTKYGDFDEAEAWDVFKNNYLMKTPEQRIIDLKACDTFIEQFNHPTKEAASVLTRKRELFDIHTRLRQAGR